MRTTNRRRIISLAALLVLALLLGACGGDAADTPAAEATSEPAEAATTAAPADDPTDTATADAATDGTDATGTEGAADGTEAAGDGVTVAVADSSLGQILVDGDGRTLYLFTSDSPGESTCYDDCAVSWPPLVSDGAATAGEGVDEALLGSVQRDDGTTQVSYDEQPLYYWQGDSSPGDVNGQGVGDVWWVVAPSGEAITNDASATSTGGGTSTASGAGGY